MSIHNLEAYRHAVRALNEVKMLQEAINSIITLSQTHVNTYPYMSAINSLANEAKISLSINHDKYKAIVESKGKIDEG